MFETVGLTLCQCPFCFGRTRFGRKSTGNVSSPPLCAMAQLIPVRDNVPHLSIDFSIRTENRASPRRGSCSGLRQIQICPTFAHLPNSLQTSEIHSVPGGLSGSRTSIKPWVVRNNHEERFAETEKKQPLGFQRRAHWVRWSRRFLERPPRCRARRDLVVAYIGKLYE